MNIVYEGQTKSGKSLLIRFLEAEDTQAMTDYINALSNEQTFVLRQGEQMTLKEEEKYVTGKLEDIAERNAVLLLAFSGDTLIGIGGIDGGEYVRSHVGDFAISVAKDWRGDGVGRIFLETILNTAVDYIEGLQIIRLEVFGNNEAAQKLYASAGFAEYGLLPRAILHKGEYVDEVHMYKCVD